VLTKADGDARGGAALSVRHVTGKPILFVGVGEKPTRSRRSSRAHGLAHPRMGDVLSLVEEVTRKVDREQAERLARKVAKGGGFDLEDLLEQLGQIEKMGGMSALMDKLPAQLAAKAQGLPQGNEREIRRQMAIIRSMTPRERRYPKVIDGSRRRRIATGSGTQVADVNRLLKNFMQMQKVMKGMGKARPAAGMVQSLAGRLPRGCAERRPAQAFLSAGVFGIVPALFRPGAPLRAVRNGRSNR